jgi:hypothetical protein
MELYEDCASKLSTFLYSSVFSQLAWAYVNAAIIMKFVSCTNINRYLRNYQHWLTSERRPKLRPAPKSIYTEQFLHKK